MNAVSMRPHSKGFADFPWRNLDPFEISHFGRIDRLQPETPLRATPIFGPHAVRIDGSGVNRFSVVRVSECGSNETAFTEIQSDFMEKSRFIRDFSFAKNPKPENGKLRLFVGKWTAAASLGAMEAAA
jgi:hypothetical protein